MSSWLAFKLQATLLANLAACPVVHPLFLPSTGQKGPQILVQHLDKEENIRTPLNISILVQMAFVAVQRVLMGKPFVPKSILQYYIIIYYNIIYIYYIYVSQNV